MKGFLKKHQDAILALAALVLLGAIAAFYFWGVGTLIVNLNTAVNPEKGALKEQSQFNIEAAKEILKRRGLAP